MLTVYEREESRKHDNYCESWLSAHRRAIYNKTVKAQGAFETQLIKIKNRCLKCVDEWQQRLKQSGLALSKEDIDKEISKRFEYECKRLGIEITDSERALADVLLIDKIKNEKQKKLNEEVVEANSQLELFQEEKHKTSETDNNTQSETHNVDNSKSTQNREIFTGARIRRAKAKLTKILERNAGKNMRFVTLTFKEQPKDFNFALECVQKMERRLRTVYGDKVKGVYVPELGEKNGRIHFHAIITLGFIRKDEFQEKFWKMGIVDIKSTHGKKRHSLQSVIAMYISKYLGKNIQPIQGRTRAYYISKGWVTDCYKFQVASSNEKDFDTIMQGKVKRGICKLEHEYFTEVNGIKIKVKRYRFQKTSAKKVATQLLKMEVEVRNGDLLRISKEEIWAREVQDKLKAYTMSTMDKEYYLNTVVDICMEYKVFNDRKFAMEVYSCLLDYWHASRIVINPIFWRQKLSCLIFNNCGIMRSTRDVMINHYETVIEHGQYTCFKNDDAPDWVKESQKCDIKTLAKIALEIGKEEDQTVLAERKRIDDEYAKWHEAETKDRLNPDEYNPRKLNAEHDDIKQDKKDFEEWKRQRQLNIKE